jgi:HKD family nuclease
MQIQFLGQGYEPKSENSVGNHLIKFFADKEFTKFTGISAFSSQAGINGISKHIKSARKHLSIITIVTGVDKKGTSKEALEALLALKIDAFVFFQPSSPIFHPKIYLFEGDEKSKLIIGSSNLTSQGLFTNVETSLLVSIDNKSEADLKIIEQLKEYFSSIFDHTDPNLTKLSKELIENLVKIKLVPTEAERKVAQDKMENELRKGMVNLLTEFFPKRAVAKIPNEFRGIAKTKSTSVNKTRVKSQTVKVPSKKYSLLWESGPLTERDLTIPKGKNTHQTGSMYLKKGLLENIDQRHYFRNEVFADLNWVFDERENYKHIERAKISLRLIVSGKDEGDFELKLTHNTDTNSKTYRQNNCMTSLLWGNARTVVANKSLIGMNAKLYKNTGVETEFTLAIE